MLFLSWCFRQRESKGRCGVRWFRLSSQSLRLKTFDSPKPFGVFRVPYVIRQNLFWPHFVVLLSKVFAKPIQTNRNLLISFLFSVWFLFLEKKTHLFFSIFLFLSWIWFTITRANIWLWKRKKHSLQNWHSFLHILKIRNILTDRHSIYWSIHNTYYHEYIDIVDRFILTYDLNCYFD